jgi:hypothetical protein
MKRAFLKIAPRIWRQNHARQVAIAVLAYETID